MDKNLENIQPGDKVIVYGGGSLAYAQVHEVERLTKTQVVLKGTITKYNRKSGRSVGSYSWYSTFIRKASPDDIKQVRAAQLRRKLSNKLSMIQWKTLSLEKLEQVWSIVGDE